MIDILRYRELLAELRENVNARSETQIEGVVVAISEKHLVKKLKDRNGLMLCANYPDSGLNGDADNYRERNKMLLFLIEKVSSGSETDEDELLHYSRIQQVMKLIKEELRSMDFACGEIDGAKEITTEWEYDVFGGFNGLSAGFNLTDYD